jgi:hypothetical protein
MIDDPLGFHRVEEINVMPKGVSIEDSGCTGAAAVVTSAPARHTIKKVHTPITPISLY